MEGKWELQVVLLQKHPVRKISSAVGKKRKRKRKRGHTYTLDTISQKSG